jgi:cellulose synthase (UDP-forming)
MPTFLRTSDSARGRSLTILKDRLYRGPRRSDAEPLARATENKAAQSPTLSLFVLVATIGVLAYTLFLFNPENRGDWLPYTLVIVAEVVLVSQALVSMWTILAGGQDPRDFTFHHTQERLFDGDLTDRLRLGASPHLWPMFIGEKRASVDVFITVYGEDIDKVRTTTVAALAIRGEHETWILDDGKSDAVRDLAAELGAKYIRRLSGNGAKAGNINHALSITKGQYFAIFDADFVPKPDFLYETMPFFIDEHVAFVQTPQAYGNMHNLVSRGAGFMQSVFYRFIQPGRNRFNAAFCVGTNVVFRRAAIEDIGGMNTDSKSEDVWTSLELHERGWRSIYIPVTLAIGDAPETVEDYTKQQMRWASGGFEILMQRNPLSPRTRLTLDQRLQYTVTATHYFAGITPFLLLMVPPLEIFFDLRPVDLTVTPLTWFLFYAGFYGLQMLLAFHTMGSFRIETLVLATVSFPIYIAALMNVFSGKEQKWHVTGSRGRRSSPFNFMIPQVMVFAFLFLTSLVAISKDVEHQTLTLATAWNVTNTILISVFIAAAFRESHRAKATDRRMLTAAPLSPSFETLPTPATPVLAYPAAPISAAPISTPVTSKPATSMPAPAAPPTRRARRVTEFRPADDRLARTSQLVPSHDRHTS